MANGRNAGGRSGSGGFSGSGRSSRGRNGGAGKGSHSRGGMNDSAAGKGAAKGSNSGGNKGNAPTVNLSGVSVTASADHSESGRVKTGRVDAHITLTNTAKLAPQVGTPPDDFYKSYLVHKPFGTDEVHLPGVEITASADDTEDEETASPQYGYGRDNSESNGNVSGDRQSRDNPDVNENVMDYEENPALKMIYNPKTNEYSLIDAATGSVVAGMELQDDGSYKSVGAWEQMEKGNPGSLAVDQTFETFEIGKDGKLDYNKVVKSMTTRKGTEPGYEYSTTTTEDTWYGKSETTAHYNPGEDKINRVDVNTKTFIGSIPTDYHTVNRKGTPKEIGGLAEAATDLFEALGDPEDTETLSSVARGVDTFATIVSVGFSLMNFYSTLPMMFKNLPATLAGLKSLAEAVEGISDLADSFGAPGYSKMNSTPNRAKSIAQATRNLYGANLFAQYFNGDGDSRRVVNDGVAGAFIESPAYGEYNYLNSGYLSPVQNYSMLNRFEKQNPTIEKGDDNMQQAIMPTALIGINNVKENHLLSADEAQYLLNVTTLSGSIESTKSHAEDINIGTYNASYEYDDDGYRGRLVYNQADEVSFADVANQTFCVSTGRLYLVNTKKSGKNILNDNIKFPYINVGDLKIRIENSIPSTLMQAILDMIQKIKVVAPVERLNQKDPKDGSLPAYSNVAAAITTPELDKNIRKHLEDGKRFFHIEGTTAANNGDRIAVALGGTTEYAVATDKVWKMDLDLLDAFGSVLNVNNNGTDEIYYAVTVYDKSSGMESLPVKSNSCFNFSKLIHLYVENPSAEHSLKIYRKDVASSMYKFISLQSYKGNNVFIDNLADIPSPQFLDFTEIKEVTGLKGLVEHKATLFAYKGSYVYFSKPGRPNIWNELQCVTVNEQITGLASSPLGLMIFTKNSTYLLGGTDRVNYAISNLSKSIGCSEPKSIANIKNAVVWIFNGDVMLSIGSTINNLTKGRYAITEIGEKLNVINALTVGDVYYIFTDKKVVKMDFSLNHPMITEMDIANGFGCQVNNELYYVKNGIIYKAYNSADLDKLIATTVKFVGGSMDLTKEFNSVNIVYKGEFKITVYIDDVEVISREFSSDKQTVADIGIPVDFNEGLGIHLKFEGKGKIFSYRYIFDNRNLR
jgi:hypothetical protein